jgi:ribonuclease HI
VFSDGSGHDGNIGAAAVLLREGHEPRILFFNLGSDEDHTVYEAEAVGLTLAAHLLSTERPLTFPASILADNQAVLKFGESTTPKARHYLVEHFRRMMETLKRTHRRHGYDVTVRWIAAHNEVEGNELADKEAKSAVEHRRNNSPTHLLPQYLSLEQLPQSLSAIKQAFKQQTKGRWDRLWAKSPRYARTHSLDPNILSRSLIDPRTRSYSIPLALLPHSFMY